VNSSLSPDPEARLQSALHGRYRLEREIGAGGMATVYLARDLKHERDVALKVLRPELAAVLGAERFLAEIKVTAALQHPNIVPLFDSGEAEGRPFFVMPFVAGESLRNRLGRDRQLPVEEALAITRQVADALAYAHSLGVIHRDVKPENILLAGGHALIADFGIARAVSVAGTPRLTATGLAVGTPAYMSPEQACADPLVDGRSDQYSLACVLYELLAGEPPFAAPTAGATLARRLTDPMPSLRAARETVPEAVEGAVRRALARAPADRFPTTSAFAEALAAPTAARSRARSVAVLPFLNMSADPENEYFADGITEDVIAQLSKIRSLTVVSRTSVMPFKSRQQGLREIADRLGVVTLLEGSVRRDGDRVRIVAQLIDAATDAHLWAQTYDRRLTDIFAIQTEVALHIAAALQAELSAEERARVAREPTADLRAYQLYQRGRQHLVLYTDEGMHTAIDYFERALERDASLAPAHVGIAIAYTELGETGLLGPDEAYPRAKAAAARALALDPDLGDAHTTAAYARMVSEFDWEGAEAEFRRALELSPSSADAFDLYGRLCSALERHDEAVALAQRAQELDPLVHRVDVATALLRAGRLAEALPAALRAVEVDREYSRSHSTLGWVYLTMGRRAEGLAELEHAVALSPADTLWRAQLGEAYAQAGMADEAREILRRLVDESRTRYVAPYHLAYIHTGLGQYDEAMDCLEQAFAQRGGAVYGIKGSFLFAPLRAHPRFRALLARMRLA
jgi:eukaryotic-like serine/threonine-protein kinase